LTALIRDGRAVLIGAIRQEVLSGIRHQAQFERLRVRLRPFEDLAVTSATHERAAELGNRCRRAGVQGSAVDFLICAAADEHGAPIFTTDADFAHYQRVLGTSMHDPSIGTQ